MTLLYLKHIFLLRESASRQDKCDTWHNRRSENSRKNWRVARDCIKADHLVTASRPARLLEGFARQAADHIALLDKAGFPGLLVSSEASICDAIASCSSAGKALTFSSVFSSNDDILILPVEMGKQMQMC